MCLDFVHTGGVGNWVAAELIHDERDLGRWLAYVLDVRGIEARAHDVVVAKRLREAMWQLAQRQVAHQPLRRQDIRIVNAAAAAPPLVPALSGDGTARTVAPRLAVSALSVLARDAVDLFSGPLKNRVRTCAADDCELLFVDASRPGQRRWCSMQRCGNIAKMRDYRARSSQ